MDCAGFEGDRGAQGEEERVERGGVEGEGGAAAGVGGVRVGERGELGAG